MAIKILINVVSNVRTIVDEKEVAAILSTNPKIKEDMTTAKELTRQTLLDHGLNSCVRGFEQASGLTPVVVEEV